MKRILIVLTLTTTACQSWVPVSRSTLRTELAQGDSDVKVATEGESFVLSRATACDLGDVVVLSGDSSRAARAFAEAHPIARGGCDCPHSPCTRLDVTRASVSLRKTDAGAAAAVGIAIGVGAIALIAVFVGLYVANGCFFCWH